MLKRNKISEILKETIDSFYAAFLLQNIEECTNYLNDNEDSVCIIGSGKSKSTISRGLSQTLEHLKLNFNNVLPKRIEFSNILTNKVGNIAWFTADRTNHYDDKFTYARFTAILEFKENKWVINHLHHSYADNKGIVK